MSDSSMGQMSSEVVEVACEGEGKFALTLRLADGRTMLTNGRSVMAAAGDGAAPRSFHFDSEDFQKEVMKGNIDIRAVCAELERVLKAAE